VLIESAADAPRKSLEPLRAASAVRAVLLPPGRAELLLWGARRLAVEGIGADPGVIESVADGCEGDALTFFGQLSKLCVWAGAGGRLRTADAAMLMKPVLDADVPAYLAAVAAGQPRLAAQRLGRLLACGVGEGQVLFALSNLVGGALGGWARWRELSETLRRRVSPGELSHALDAVYRAEAAWKGGRADVVAVLEQATRDVSGGS
jgi:DNA polymerase III delta subunit